MKLSLSIITIALLLPQEKNDAEEIFKALVEKLSKAETVQVESRASLDCQKHGEKWTALITGKIFLHKDGHARLEYEGQNKGPVSSLIVSDAITTTWVSGKRRPSLPAQPTLRRDAIALLARTGSTQAITVIGVGLRSAEMEEEIRQRGGSPEPREADPLKRMRIGQFTRVPAEKVDGRAVIALQFIVEYEGETGKTTVTVWIDSETRLPIRRRVIDEGEGTLTEESYSVFNLDEKIDPAKFELPK